VTEEQAVQLIAIARDIENHFAWLRIIGWFMLAAMCARIASTSK